MEEMLSFSQIDKLFAKLLGTIIFAYMLQNVDMASYIRLIYCSLFRVASNLVRCNAEAPRGILKVQKLLE